MITDKYGQYIYTEKDLCEFYLTNPERQLKNALTSDTITFADELDINHLPQLVTYSINEDLTVEQFDAVYQNNFFIPLEYASMDIAKFVLEQCQTEEELQRAGTELLLYQERDMFILLCYLKYLVDTMRSNNIVWGVGRGSSVSSFVLFLIGIHKINSLYYDLPVEEFLK
jgi:DNA polymerase III alpha subunit